MPASRHQGPIRKRSVPPAGALVIACAAACACAPLHAQDASNLRLRRLAVTGDTLAIDTLSLVPGSLLLFADGLPVNPASYSLDPWSAQLVWNEHPGADSVLARYRVLPLAFARVRRHKDPDRLIGDPFDRDDPFRYVPPRQQDGLLGRQGLNRSGSISRGVLFGNNQDLSVNSTLNLELSGRLTDRINVLASITDNNIPIQAGGNTLELQDFDQVFIKLFEDDPSAPGARWELIAGDFVLQRPRSHFLTYLKKAKGLSHTQRYGGSGTPRGEAGASLAISKGRFARNLIQGIEGVQGPYRLRGNAGEPFIVVLSGTERVFIDGQPLLRGQENDYVIDYNTAEITFTARRLITKDRRIAVEFQYSDKNYARSLMRVEDVTVLGRTTVRANLFSEQDHRNQPVQQQLTDQEKQTLGGAGDDPLAASVPGVDSTGWSADQVLYRRTDSLGYSPVYVYSTDPENAVFRLTFTRVGPGNGDYVQQEFTPNGRVFRWVKPDTVNGAPVRQGDHAPIRVLIAPRSQQLVTLGASHRFGAKTNATVEVAYSHSDLNTFSTADDGDNDGLGVLLSGEHAVPLSQGDTSLHLVLGAGLETVSRDFTFVERYRAVEFERNWNARGIGLVGDQVLAEGRVGVRGRELGSASLGIGTFNAGDSYAGLKQDLLADLHPGRTDITGMASHLSTRIPFESDFLRHKFQWRHRLRPFTIGLADEHEWNRFRRPDAPGLTTGSYRFYDWEAFVQSPDTFRNKWRLGGGQRYEQALSGDTLAPSTRATAGNATLELGRDPAKRLGLAFTYRSLSILDSSLTAQRPEETWLARIDHGLTAWKGAASLSLFYEFGSGLEQRREYIYVEVPAGQGLYVWIDYNGNGIKDLNEFELAAFGYEANYLRVFVPSDSYVRAFSNQFSASLDLRPGVRWGDAGGAKGFLGKFSDLASFRVDRKTGTDDPLLAMDPFRPELADTALTAYQASARNTLYYDRTSRHWSVDHTWQNDRGRSLLLNGYEARSRLLNTLRFRWNVARHWTADVESERGRSANASDLLAGRTWSIEQTAVRPRLTWQPNTSLRAVVHYKHTEKRNEEEYGGEHAVLRDLGAEFRYNTAGRGSVTAAVNLVRIGYDGAVNTALGNEMLQGLKPGTNVTWSVGVQRNLNNNLQVDLTYNGRRSEGVPVVHVGGAQVRAFF